MREECQSKRAKICLEEYTIHLITCKDSVVCVILQEETSHVISRKWTECDTFDLPLISTLHKLFTTFLIDTYYCIAIGMILTCPSGLPLSPRFRERERDLSLCRSYQSHLSPVGARRSITCDLSLNRTPFVYDHQLRECCKCEFIIKFIKWCFLPPLIIIFCFRWLQSDRQRRFPLLPLRVLPTSPAQLRFQFLAQFLTTSSVRI